MRILMVALFLLLSFSDASFAEDKWSGRIGARYTKRFNDDGLGSRNAAGKDSSRQINQRYELRAGTGLIHTGEGPEWGFAVRTQNGASSEWITAQSAIDRTLGLELAYFKLTRDLLGGEISLSAGRQKPPFLFDAVAQAFLDTDVRFDGLGWNWKRGDLSVALSQYVIGAKSLGVVGASTFNESDAAQADPNTRSGFGWLFGMQPSFKHKFNDETDAQFALGYFTWSSTGASSTSGFFTNAIHGGQAGSVGNVDPVVLDNSRQWQFYTAWNLPWKLRATGEYVRNKKIRYGTRIAPTSKEADNTAYSASISWNKVKKGEFAATYYYTHRGIASAIAAFGEGDIVPDMAGHSAYVSYGVADSMSVTFRYWTAKELGKVGGDGLSLASPNEKRRQSLERFDLALSASF